MQPEESSSPASSLHNFSLTPLLHPPPKLNSQARPVLWVPEPPTRPGKEEERDRGTLSNPCPLCLFPPLNPILDQALEPLRIPKISPPLSPFVLWSCLVLS